MGWLQFVRCCVRPDVTDFTEFTKKATVEADEQDRVLEGVTPSKPTVPCSFVIGALSPKVDQVSRTTTDGFLDVQGRDVLAAASLPRVDTLAPLAEDEALAPSDQGALLEEANRTESHWSDASRSSCPTVVIARGCSPVTTIEPGAGGGAPFVRLHAIATAPKDICVSPVSVATGRSAASPMRHDFMTLMRQASNRGSSSGLVHDPTGLLIPPQMWAASPVHGSDTRRGGVIGHRIPGPDWTTATTRQTHGGESLTLTLTLEPSLNRRQRRTSACAAAGGDAAAGPPAIDDATLGDAGDYCPPACTMPAGTVAAMFTRCSSSPDIVPGLLGLHRTSTSRAPGGVQEMRMGVSPFTAPPTVGQAGSSVVSCNSFGTVSPGDGSCSGGGGGGGLPPAPASLVPAMLRGSQASMGRNGPMQQLPTHSPLRPRDLPPPAASGFTAGTSPAAYLAAGAAAGGHLPHSASALPTYCNGSNGSGGAGMGRRPASGVAPNGSSYQQIRLLQQLREQHELYNHQQHHRHQQQQQQQAATAAAAANVAALAAATATGTGTGVKFPVRPSTTASSGSEPRRWVETCYTAEPGLAVAAFPERANQPSTAVAQRGVSAISASLALRPPPDASTLIRDAGLPAASDVSIFSQECSGALLLEGASGALTSVSALLTPALRSRWADRSCGFSGGGGGDSWAVGSDSVGGRVPPTAVPEPSAMSKLAVDASLGGGGGGTDGSSSSSMPSSAAALQAVIVGSLGETLSIATKAAGADPQLRTSADHHAEAAAEAVLVLESLLQRNGLPDADDLSKPAADEASGPCLAPLGCRPAAASPIFGAFCSGRTPDGDGKAGGSGSDGGPRRNAWTIAPVRQPFRPETAQAVGYRPRSNPTSSPQRPPAGGHEDATRPNARPCLVDAMLAVAHLERPVTTNSHAWGHGTPRNGTSGADGSAVRIAPASPCATAFPAVPEPILMLLSRTPSPSPESLGGSGLTTRSGTALLTSPQPSERATPAASAGGAGTAAAAAASLLPASPAGLLADAVPFRTPSVCSLSPSHLLASPTFLDSSPSTPASQGPRSCRSMRSLSGQRTSTGAAAVQSGSKGASLSFGCDGASSCLEHENGVGEGRAGTGPCRAAEVVGAAECSGGGAGGSGGCKGVTRGRGSTGAGRGSSVLASESSLAAIALLRSAAANCTLPDDGVEGDGGAGASTRIRCLHNICTAMTAGGSWRGLDSDAGGSAAIAGAGGFAPSATASPSNPSSTMDAARSQPLVTLFSSLAWPPPAPPALPVLAMPAPASLQGRTSPRALPRSPSRAPPPSGTVVQRQQHLEAVSPQSLRLEDGLVADPLLLVDGLGQLSYVTSGAYAAVYRGALEDVRVGIKFLASTSLDLNAPAVKEALLGPGLEHENIIRTYTTRVARVDARAVAQLRGVAAAMAAAAALHRKRSSASARRNSTGAAACLPRSLPPTPIFPQPGTAATAAAAEAHRRTAGAAAAPAPLCSAAAVSACTSPAAASPAARPTPPATPPAVVTAAVGTSRKDGSGHSQTSGMGHLQLLLQGSPAKDALAASPRRPRDADSTLCTASYPCPGTEVQSGMHAGAEAEAEAKGRLVSASGAFGDQGRAAAAEGAAGGGCGGGWSTASGSPARQMYIRKSISENVRVRMDGHEEAAAEAHAGAQAMDATAPLRPAQPSSLQLTPPSKHSAAGAAAAGSCGHPPTRGTRRGSAHQLTDSRKVMLPLVPQFPSMSHLPQLGSAVVGGCITVPAPAPPPRGGSAAERMLDVLRTLGVVGPTGQPTAEAHYVTAVVMEFADAGNLDTFSRSQAPCDLRTAVDLLRQVARGMSYLHAHGLVHGDLKPANVLLLRESTSGRLVAKVADFGLSGLSGQLGCCGGADTCGTVAYSAPERLSEEDGGSAEQAADVYSFGICMQQLVSGVRPFADLSFAQVMFSVLCLKMRPPWPEARCGALEPLYDMCCDPQPAKRPTFDQVVAWLDSLWV